MAERPGVETAPQDVEVAAAKESTGVLRRVTRIQTFQSLNYANFRWLWLGSVASQVGNWMQQVALGWLVLDMTNSAFLLGAVGFVRSAPILIFSLAGGVAADRIDRRNLLLLTQTVSGGLALLLAVLISTGLVQVWEIFVVTFLMGIAMAFNQPTRQALIVDTVGRESIANAVSLNMAAVSLTRVLGPTAAGLLIASVGVAGCYFIQAGGFLVGLLCSFPIKIQGSGIGKRKSTAWQDFVEGLRYIRSNRTVAALILVEAFPGFFTLPYLALMPIFAKDVLHVGAEGLGIMMAVPGAGALVGALLLASMGNYRYKGWLALISAFVLSSSMIGFALSTSYPLTLVVLVVIGAFGMNFSSIVLASILSIVPGGFQGRVTSLHSLAFAGMMPLGSAAEGAVAGLIGAPITLAIGGAIAALFTIFIAVSVPRVRQVH